MSLLLLMDIVTTARTWRAWTGAAKPFVKYHLLSYFNEPHDDDVD